MALSAIPVGGSASANSGGAIVLAQPSTGTVVAFSAICTHQGCTVNSGGAQLHCPCHGSVYNAFTGAVVQGPAPLPLPKVAVHVTNGYVVAG
jgi:Rieske Fe-S protein